MNEATEKKLIQKRKRKLNLIDVILIVLVVLILGIFLSYRFFIAGDNVQEVRLSYRIEVEGVGEQLQTDKLLGDLLYTDSGICLGKVAQCSEIMTKTHIVTTAEDTYSKQTTHYVVVTVTCDAVRNKESYRISGYLLETGAQLELTSNDFYVKGTCIDMAEVTQ